MARYEKTRKYVVAAINKGTVALVAPKGRAYATQYFSMSSLPARAVKSLKVGSKVTLYRFSNQYTTYFAPKA